MWIIDWIKTFRLSTEQNYTPPWETLNRPPVILFLKYYAAGVLIALMLALLYSTYGSYFALCRDTPQPKSANLEVKGEGMSSSQRTSRHFHHRRYDGYTMQRDFDPSMELETVSP